MMKPFTLEWVITEKEEGITIKEFLQRKNLSKRALTEIKLHGGDLLINGSHVTVRHLLQKSDCLTVIFPVEEVSPSLLVEKIPLNIIYEDEMLLVVNKPAFMNTIPSREHPVGSLANALMGYYENIGLTASPHIVTRLDRNTSGLVLIAKHRHIHHLLSESQKRKHMKREYEAIVEGTVLLNAGTIEAPIGRKKDSIIERTVVEDGQYACTHYQVLTRLANMTHVKLQLETGRTHQIRVHMAHIGHPLVGDGLYGGGTEYLNRQALHCRRLCFLHPMLGEKMEFTASRPSDLETLLKRDYSKG